MTLLVVFVLLEDTDPSCQTALRVQSVSKRTYPLRSPWDCRLAKADESAKLSWSRTSGDFSRKDASTGYHHFPVALVAQVWFCSLKSTECACFCSEGDRRACIKPVTFLLQGHCTNPGWLCCLDVENNNSMLSNVNTPKQEQSAFNHVF